ncbi:MAG TPA: hypothetical protein PKW79_00035 [Rhabdochlamydiaceae bacterium]|nr:hypothetical protein [Rhabdochlamydiaceae bacterium]
MKFKVDQLLKDLDGKPFKEKKKENGKEIESEIALSVIMVNALLEPQVGPDGRIIEMSGSQKIENWKLAKKIHKKEIAELTSEEVVKIKAAVGKGNPFPMSVGQVEELLESPIPEEPKKEEAK